MYSYLYFFKCLFSFQYDTVLFQKDSNGDLWSFLKKEDEDVRKSEEEEEEEQQQLRARLAHLPFPGNLLPSQVLQPTCHLPHSWQLGNLTREDRPWVLTFQFLTGTGEQLIEDMECSLVGSLSYDTRLFQKVGLC